MEPSEEKFFEELAKVSLGKEERERDYEVGLAKASSATASRTRAMKKEEEKEEISDEIEGQLTIDVYQTPSDIVIESAIAGVNPDDLDVSVSTDSVTIRGERRRGREIEENDYLYQECYWGRFSRSVILPQEVDPDGASVTLKNGVLTVRLPKLNKKKTKKLKVKAE